MFGKYHIFKIVAALAVAVALAVLGARSAKAGNPYNPGAYVYGGASQTVAQAIQSAGFGSGREVSSARQAKASKRQSFHLITDTLGGNGQPKVVVQFKQESVRMIPDFLGGNGQPKLPLRTLESVRHAKHLAGSGLITDTLGGNGHASLPAGGSLTVRTA